MPDYTNLIYYQVGNKKILNPIEAWREILRSGQAFHLNIFDGIYDSRDWTKDPEMPWSQLCRLRAQQLRDRYQWLRLYYSAGRDSHLMLESFVANHIHVDEIVVIHNRFDLDKNQDIENIVLPSVQQYLKRMPGTVLTVLELVADDWTHEFRRYFSENISAGSQGAWSFHPFGQCNLIKRSQHRFDPRSKGLSVGDVNGLEKPRLMIQDGWWVTYMIDVQFYTNMHDGNMEYFYLSPDLPELYIKQAWMLINHLERHHADKSPGWIKNFCESFDPALYDEHCLAIGRLPAIHAKTGLALDKVNRHERYATMINHHRTLKSPQYRNWQEHLRDLSSEMPQAFNNGSAFSGTKGIYSKIRKLKPYLGMLAHTNN